MLPVGQMIYVCEFHFISLGPTLFTSGICNTLGFKLRYVVLAFKLLQIERDKFTERFQHGNTRISEIVRSKFFNFTNLLTKQMHADKIHLFVYYIYVHQQISVFYCEFLIVLEDVDKL